MRRALLPAALAPLALAAPLVPAPAGAQTGPQLTATISQRFELDTNIDLAEDSPGLSFFGDTRLALGLNEETPTQRFSLGFDTGIRALWRAEQDFEFTFASPSTASAAWGRDWASGNVNASARYRQARLDFTRPLEVIGVTDLGEIVVLVPDDPAALEGDAVERRLDGSFGIALATDAPSSYSVSLSASRTDYSDDTPSLTPRTTLQGNATWQLRLTPVFSGTLSARGFLYEADNPQETRIREAEIDAGVIYDPSPQLSLSAGLGIVDRERSELVGGTRTTASDGRGLSLRTGANYALDDFTVSASLRAATEPGTRLSGNVSASYPLPDGQVNARLFQSFAGGAGGEEIRVTGLGFGLTQALDPVSRVSFDISGTRRVNVEDPDEADVDRVDFTTSLGYDLTERLSATLGYRFRFRDEGEAATGHAVFFQIGRSFETGF